MQKSPADYIIQQITEADLWDQDELQQMEMMYQELQKCPQQFEQYLLKYLGRRKSTKNLIKKLKDDLTFIQSLENKSYPLHKIFLKITKQDGKKNILYVPQVKLDQWKEQNINSTIQQSFIKTVQQAFDHGSEIDKFIRQMYYNFLDILIRKGDLQKKYLLIRKVAKTRNLEQIQNCTFSDFIVLLMKTVPNSQLSYFGQLLHQNSLLMPLIVSVKDQSQWISQSFIEILENIVIQQNYKLICNIGTQETRKKGKTQFLMRLFNQEESKFTQRESQFRENSVFIFTSTGSTSNDERYLVADFNGDLQYFIQNNYAKQLLAISHANILHVSKNQYEKKNKNINQLKEINSNTRHIYLIRDFKEQHNIDQDYYCIPNQNLLDQFKRSEKQKQIYKLLTQKLMKSQCIKYQDLLEDASKKKFQQQKLCIQSIISNMSSQSLLNLWDTCFPNLQNCQKLCELDQQIIRKKADIKFKKLTDTTEQLSKLEKLKQERKKKQIKYQHSGEPSKLIQKYLQNYQAISLKIVSSEIGIWKKKMSIQKLIKQLVIIKSQISKENKQDKVNITRIQELQNQIDQVDISLDTFIQQIVLLYEQFKNDSQKYRECLNNYYINLHQKMNPIILIDGKILKYGNSFLKQFFRRISNEYKQNKKIHVISVIGAQSSAKSTLLNYLFNCRFETSAGRCTKGVYITIVQTEEEIFIVIDSQGLMSVSARNRTFDIQIASFILLISDLVIINNKGQLNTSIQQLLGVCTYSLKQLNKREEAKKKSKLLFAIRDQQKGGVMEQQMMLGDIIKKLRDNIDLVNYEDYLDFDSDDIFPLESAFMRSTNCQKIIPNSRFSEQILVIRSKIVQIFKHKVSNYSTLFEFYQYAETVWQSIKQCGDSIFNFKQVYEIKIKKKLNEFQQKILQKQMQIMNQEYLKCRQYIQNSKDNSLLQTVLSKLKVNTNKILQSSKKQLIDKAKSEFGPNIRKQWVNESLNGLEMEFIQKNILHKTFLEDRFKQNRIKNKQISFKNKIDEILKEILQSSLEKQKILQRFNKQCKQFLTQDNQYTQQANQVAIEQCLVRKLKDVLNVNLYQKNYSNMKLGEKFGYFFQTNRDSLIKDKQRKKLVKILEKNHNTLKQKIPQINLHFNFITQINDTDDLIRKFQGTLWQYLDILEQSINQITKSWKISSCTLNKEKYKHFCYRKFVEIMTEQIRNNIKMRKETQIQNKQQIIQQKKKLIDRQFDIKGNALIISEEAINSLKRHLLKYYFKKTKDSLLSYFQKISTRFSRQSIIKKALTMTFKAEQLNKTTYIQCFKLIYDFNKYLKQAVLRKQPEFTQIQVKIDEVLKQMLRSIQQRLKKIKDKVESSQKFSDIISMKQLEIAHLKDNEDIFKVIKIQLKKKLQAKQLNYLSQYFENQILKTHHLKKQLQQFINKKIQRDIYPRIVGCQQRCPFCSMKCQLNMGHQQGHECLQGTHILQCFAGTKYHKSNIRENKMCCTNQLIEKETWHDDQSDSYLPTLKWLQKKYPRWLLHISNTERQNNYDKQLCEKIWSNIGDVLIETKQKSMKNDNVRKDLISDPICYQDIKNWIILNEEEQNLDDVSQ